MYKLPVLYLSLMGVLGFAILLYILNTPQPIAVPIALPISTPFAHAIAASGILEAVDKNIMIGTPEEGIVVKVFASSCDVVKKGDPLYEIDSRPLTALLIYQESAAEIAKACLKQLQDQLNLLKNINDPRAVSISEIDTKENAVLIAKAELKSTLAAMIQTKTLIDRLTIRAPKDGTILQCNIREGEYVAKNIPTMLLGDLSHIQIRADIDEQNASLFNPLAKAVAFPKNNPLINIPLTFVRLEPYILPKVSLTGMANERVDTRVLQVIYSCEQPEKYHLYVGQQVDLFIERS